MAHFHNNSLIGSGGTGGDTQYTIQRSLRFNKADSAYLNRTPSSQGNRKTWTWSGWVKRSGNDSDHHLFVGDKASSASLSDTTFGRFYIESGGAIRYSGYTTAYRTTNALLRDQSAWYHIVLAVDTTQSTADDRIKIYLNGSQITSFATKNNPSQDAELAFNQTTPHTIGARSRSGTIAHWLDGYLAEIHFVDGAQLAASDFGEYDDGNIWQPKEFTGSYGTTVAAPYTGTVPSSTTDVPPAGSYGNGIATAAVLFGGTILTNGQNHIRQDGGGIEWSAAIPLSSGDVAGAQCLYFNNTSAHTIQFKINGSWVDVQQNAQNVIGSTQGQGALITYTATGSANWTGVKATGGSNISVTTVAGIFVNGNLVGENDTVGVNGFYLKFADNSSKAALGTDSSGNNNTWTVNNLIAQGPAATQFKVYGNVSNSGSSSTINVSSLSTLQSTNVSTYNIGGTNHNHLTADLGSVGTHAIQARTYLNIGTDILVFVSNNGSSWSSISNQQDPYIFTGRYIQWVRTGQGYDNQVLTAVSAASETDSMIDTPTNYTPDSGNAGGNYAVLNALNSTATLSNGNLDQSGTGNSHATIRIPSSGKWYYELTVEAQTNGFVSGIQALSTPTTPNNSNSMAIAESGARYNGDGSRTNSFLSAFVVGDTLGVAIDQDGDTINFYRNGTAGGSTLTPSSLGSELMIVVHTNATTVNLNFGQRPFAYTPPTGHVSLCTQNLADPTIAEGASVFDITLYTGNGSGQTISGLDFSPDWVWIKRRSGSTDHCINDTVRGAGKQLNINQNYAEVTNTNNFAAFTSDGFTVGNGSQTNAANPPETHVAWTWDAGESNTSITAGSLNSTAYNTDRVWSNGIANSNSDFDQAKTNAFNGNRSNMLRTGGNQVLVTLNFSPALTVSNSIEILGEGWPTAGATFVFTVDGSTTTKTTTQGRPATFDVSGSLTRITMQNSSSNGRTYLTYIKVDGKELIDSNITPPNIPLIASTVRTNQSAGFSIVSYEGNNTGGATIGHGLNVQPKFIVVKDRDSTSGWWAVYHDGVGAGKGGYLNDGQAFSAQSHWSYSDPSSSVFYVGANANTNANQNDFIAYCFAPVEGYSAFGSYTGNGSANGPFIYTGFRPRWLMIKSSSNSGEDWLLLDTSRDPSNTANSTAMYASQRHADNSTNAITTDILSNGFKCIGTNAATNASGYTYIYHAFAEHPFKTARAR